MPKIKESQRFIMESASGRGVRKQLRTRSSLTRTLVLITSAFIVFSTAANVCFLVATNHEALHICTVSLLYRLDNLFILANSANDFILYNVVSYRFRLATYIIFQGYTRATRKFVTDAASRFCLRVLR